MSVFACAIETSTSCGQLRSGPMCDSSPAYSSILRNVDINMSFPLLHSNYPSPTTTCILQHHLTTSYAHNQIIQSPIIIPSLSHYQQPLHHHQHQHQHQHQHYYDYNHPLAPISPSFPTPTVMLLHNEPRFAIRKRPHEDCSTPIIEHTISNPLGVGDDETEDDEETIKYTFLLHSSFVVMLL